MAPVPEKWKRNEGGFVQTVFFGKGQPGDFGFRSDAHWTESSPSATPEVAAKLFGEWSRYWDLRCSVLLEKTPTSLLRTRFLQALFPEARFIAIQRHPVAVSLGTGRWPDGAKFSLEHRFRHYFHCHDIFQDDLRHLRHCMLIRYEDFIADAPSMLAKLHRFIGVNPVPFDGQVDRTTNNKYFRQWKGLASSKRNNLIKQFGSDAKKLGYSMVEPYYEP